MTTLPVLDTSCFSCGSRRTLTLFICDFCFERQFVTVHPNWTDPAYWDEVERLNELTASKRRTAEKKLEDAA